MTRCLLFLLLFISTPSFAQHYHHRGHGRERRERVRRPYTPRWNAVTGDVNIGVFCGFFGSKISAEYERYTGKDGSLGLTIGAGGYSGGTIRLSELYYGEVNTGLGFGFIAPGFRFHTDGNARRSDLAIGLTFPLGQGTRTEKKRVSAANIDEVRSDGFFGAFVGQITGTFRSYNGFVFGPWVSAGFAYAMPQPVYGDNTSPIIFQVGMRLGGSW